MFDVKRNGFNVATEATQSIDTYGEIDVEFKTRLPYKKRYASVYLFTITASEYRDRKTNIYIYVTYIIRRGR